MVAQEKEMIRCRAIIEILGRPKEHVEETIKLVVEKIRQTENISVLKEAIAPVTPNESSLFSTFVELEMVIKGISTLISFCFDHMPSSLEIEKPEELMIRNTQLSGIFNDLQAKLHNVDMVAKKLRMEGDALTRSLNTLMQNMIAILTSIGKASLEDLSKFSGLDGGLLKKFLDSLVKDGKAIKDGENYKMAQGKRSL
ncbi:hypothetical protein HYU13_00205 [Candidatus Woesearchaeota archaeon]|nr:hypothetical protein [Candidatus Woesearchaeota archaeon]